MKKPHRNKSTGTFLKTVVLLACMFSPLKPLMAQDAASYGEQNFCLEWGKLLVDQINESFHSVNGLNENSGYFEIVGYKLINGFTSFASIPVVSIYVDSTGYPSESGAYPNYFAIWPYYDPSVVFPGWNNPSIAGPNGSNVDPGDDYIPFTVPYTSGPNAGADAPVVWQGVDFSDYGDEDSIDLVQLYYNIFGYPGDPFGINPMPWNFPEENMVNGWENFWGEWYAEDNVKEGNTVSTAALVAGLMSQENPSLQIQMGNMWKLEKEWFLGIFVGLGSGLQTSWWHGYHFFDTVYYPSIIGDTVPGYGAPTTYDGLFLDGGFEGNSLADDFPVLFVGEIPVKMDTATTGHFLTFHWKVSGPNRWHATRWNVTLTPQPDPEPEPERELENDWFDISVYYDFEEADPDPDDYIDLDPIGPPKITGPFHPVVLPGAQQPTIASTDIKLDLELSSVLPVIGPHPPNNPVYPGEIYEHNGEPYVSWELSVEPSKQEPEPEPEPCNFDGEDQIVITRSDATPGLRIVLNFDYDDLDTFDPNTTLGVQRREQARLAAQDWVDIIAIPYGNGVNAVETSEENSMHFTINRPAIMPWESDATIELVNPCLGDHEVVFFLGGFSTEGITAPAQYEGALSTLAGANMASVETEVTFSGQQLWQTQSQRRGRTIDNVEDFYVPFAHTIIVNESSDFNFGDAVIKPEGGEASLPFRGVIAHEMGHALGIGPIGLPSTSAELLVPFLIDNDLLNPTPVLGQGYVMSLIMGNGAESVTVPIHLAMPNGAAALAWVTAVTNTMSTVEQETLLNSEFGYLYFTPPLYPGGDHFMFSEIFLNNPTMGLPYPRFPTVNGDTQTVPLLQSGGAHDDQDGETFWITILDIGYMIDVGWDFSF